MTTNPELDALFATMPVSDWEKALIRQAVLLIGEHAAAFSMNSIRDLMPELAHGAAGRVLRGMRQQNLPPIREIGQVRSTSGPTHSKPIAVYTLTWAGREELRRMREQRTRGAAA